MQQQQQQQQQQQRVRAVQELTAAALQPPLTRCWCGAEAQALQQRPSLPTPLSAACSPTQVNINPAYRAAELTYALNQASVTALVLAKGLKGSREFIEIVDSVVAQTQLQHRILLADDAPEGEPAVPCCAVLCCVPGLCQSTEATRQAYHNPCSPTRGSNPHGCRLHQLAGAAGSGHSRRQSGGSAGGAGGAAAARRPHQHPVHVRCS